MQWNAVGQTETDGSAHTPPHPLPRPRPRPRPRPFSGPCTRRPFPTFCPPSHLIFSFMFRVRT